MGLTCAVQEALAETLSSAGQTLRPQVGFLAGLDSAAASGTILTGPAHRGRLLTAGDNLQVQTAYFRVFFQFLREEWQGIDRLRLDKFLMLARKFVRQLFSICLG